MTGNQSESRINLSTVNVRKLIQDIADLELPTLTLKKLDLKITIGEEVPVFIESDQVKIHRILLNLLGNAVKFTENGFVEIGVRLGKKIGQQHQLNFFIRDTGKGIKPEDQHKIFQKFYRGTSSYEGVYKGYGVGLHIVKKYTKILKGKITVDSKPNKGTVFTLTILVTVTNNAALSSQSHLQSDPLSPTDKIISPSLKAREDNKIMPSILLIEDNIISLKVAENTVKKAGCHFLSAKNGAKALELFTNNQFSLVLSDIGLPDITGTSSHNNLG